MESSRTQKATKSTVTITSQENDDNNLSLTECKRILSVWKKYSINAFTRKILLYQKDIQKLEDKLDTQNIGRKTKYELKINKLYVKMGILKNDLKLIVTRYTSLENFENNIKKKDKVSKLENYRDVLEKKLKKHEKGSRKYRKLVIKLELNGRQICENTETVVEVFGGHFSKEFISSTMAMLNQTSSVECLPIL